MLAGRYRLGRILGSGGAGVVREGEDTLLRRPVAIKHVRLPAVASEQEREIARERVLREARVAARLRHPGLVAVYDVIESEDAPWIVMELVEGRSLAELIREEGRLAPGVVARMGVSLAYALEAAHRSGVVHRDVKPGNVLVTPEGQPRLTDFGIAVSEGDPALTNTGIVVGSPAYIPPERARGSRVAAPGDVWGLGATLFTAVEGESPYAGEGALATLAAIVEDRRRPFRYAGPLGPVLADLLNPDPWRRPSLPQARVLLRRIADTEPGPPPGLEDLAEDEMHRGEPARSEPRERPRRWGAAGVGRASTWPPRRGREGSAQPAGQQPPLSGDAADAGAADLGRPVSGDPNAGGPEHGRTDVGQRGQDVVDPPVAADHARTPARDVDAPAADTHADMDTAGSTDTGAAAGEAAETVRPAESPLAATMVDPAAGAVPVRAERPLVGESWRRGLAGSSGPSDRFGPVGSATPVGAAGSADPPGGPGRQRSRRVTVLVLVVVALLAVGGAALGLVLTGGSDGADGRSAVGPSTSAGPVRGGTTPPGGTAGGGGTSTPTAGASAGPSTAPSSPAAGAVPALDAIGTVIPNGTDPAPAPAGLATHQGAAGWSVAVPTDWRYTSRGPARELFSAPGGFPELLVESQATAGPSALAAWEQLEPGVSRSSPGYRRVSIRPADGGAGTSAAIWEFTSTSNGRTVHTLDYAVVRNGHGYALRWRVPEDQWDPNSEQLRQILASFRPGS